MTDAEVYKLRDLILSMKVADPATLFSEFTGEPTGDKMEREFRVFDPTGQVITTGEFIYLISVTKDFKKRIARRLAESAPPKTTRKRGPKRPREVLA